MNYSDFVVFNPKAKEVANDILCIEFWKPEFCDIITKVSDEINLYQSNPNDNVPGQELRINLISEDFYVSFCKHWKQNIQVILNDFFMLPSDQWFVGWKMPFIIKYEMSNQRYLRPHFDDSNVSGLIKLNDNYSGGDLVFPRQKFKNTNIPIGSILVWPSGVQHIHYSDHITSGTKYSFVAWTKNHPQQSGLNYEEI